MLTQINVWSADMVFNKDTDMRQYYLNLADNSQAILDVYDNQTTINAEIQKMGGVYPKVGVDNKITFINILSWEPIPQA